MSKDLDYALGWLAKAGSQAGRDALARYAIAQELVRLAHEEGCSHIAHSAASKGNDQVRLETAVAAQDPKLTVLVPVRSWPLRTLDEKLAYARRRNLPIVEPQGRQLSVDRNLWGVSLFLDDLVDSWQAPPSDIYQVTRAPEQAPDQPVNAKPVPSVFGR